jgi:hypothetical protein
VYKGGNMAYIGNWYLEEKHTYLSIYGATNPPHLLHVYVLNRLMVGYIFYHSIMQGFNSIFFKDKKRIFIHYGFQVGYYSEGYQACKTRRPDSVGI